MELEFISLRLQASQTHSFFGKHLLDLFPTHLKVTGLMAEIISASRLEVCWKRPSVGLPCSASPKCSFPLTSHCIPNHVLDTNGIVTEVEFSTNSPMTTNKYLANHLCAEKTSDETYGKEKTYLYQEEVFHCEYQIFVVRNETVEGRKGTS
eukprot:TRINITY_DN4033_c0_g1_i11.p1 TRINITY_DN4033_c0_g1~~TRINITY_DN4033_c0_g1_i11.p1  ORF type:complete len:151 (-),score=9.46 TRINITY_DN4033_c0_g1_i11:564-1016(-)